ncbi:chloride channel protein [Novosphingobium sp.]|uniref:chloride channel protein n=1 Tax=Novosphingobium sp. TaxID=1874826 RepID=UPI0035B453CD
MQQQPALFTRIRSGWQALRSGKAELADARRRIATLLGAVLLGLVAILFAKLGDFAQSLFQTVRADQPYVPMLLTPAAFGLFAWLTTKLSPESRGSGIPQVIAAVQSPVRAARGPLVSLRTAFIKFWLTLGMLLVGGSVGREGPTVQISAAIMVWTHRLMRVRVTAGVLIAGGAAGVAAAFNTPLAGVAFAIEELASAYEQRVTMLVMGAVMVAGMVSLGVSGDYVYFGVTHDVLGVKSVLLLAPIAGIVGGVAGGLFSLVLVAFAQQSSPLVRLLSGQRVVFAIGCGAVVAAVGLLTNGATWGTGYAITRGMIEGHGDGGGSLFGLAKFVTTAATAISGAPGGIFAPSLSAGAGLGQMLTALLPNEPAGAVVLLGMAGYFVGVVRAPLTAVIIIMETTASRGMILPLFATALIADFVSARVCPEKLYHALSHAFMLPGPGGHSGVEHSGPDAAAAKVR